MFGGVYGDARMPNWPHWHCTPLPGIATMGLRRDKGGLLALIAKRVDNSCAHIVFSWDGLETCLQLWCKSSVAGLRLATDDSWECHKTRTWYKNTRDTKLVQRFFILVHETDFSCFIFALFCGRSGNFAKHLRIFSRGSGWNHLHEKIVQIVKCV